MIVRTNVLVRGFPVWIELDGADYERDWRFHLKVAEEILEKLIKDEMERRSSGPQAEGR